VTSAYRDPSVPLEQRVDDLLARMTLEEKAGLMFHPPILMNADGTLIEEEAGFLAGGTTDLIANRHLNHFNIYYAPEPRLQAEWHNRLQEVASSTRLGIPVTISSDPRHSYEENLGAAWSGAGFSKWPEPIGFAALGDERAVEEFGEIARQEYRAVGIHVALHPMADLATEPRWARIMHTFGEDQELAARCVGAYVRGFQGRELGPTSVACMTKHFPGGGPQRDGEDPHFPYGKDQVYPGGMFEYHLRVFEAAFAAGTAQIMPYYGRPVGTELEEVGFGYNRDVVTGLLRGRYGFDGVVCTDWALVTDTHLPDGSVWEAKAWGVEELSTSERVAKIVDAGCDQLGGERLPEVIVELVESGRLTEERIDESARRLLRDKFRLGLFDERRIDPGAAERICGNAEFVAAGERMQRRSAVVLKNDGVLPLAEGADVAVVRRATPFEARNGNFIESVFHAGDLDFKEPELSELLAAVRAKPTVLVLHLERPAVVPELVDACAAVVAVFGASDEAVDDVLHGRVQPEGRLPFELPRSMDAVRAQQPDVPHDSADPLFPFGHGLSL
jgi:beta-glucosidase